MKLKVRKSTLSGSVVIPGSKSHTIRAVVIGSLVEGTSRIRNPLLSSDTLSAVECYRSLGAQIDTSNENVWLIRGTAGRILNEKCSIDVGNSSTTLRLAIGSAALASDSARISLTGDQQIRERPIAALLQSLADLGAAGVSVNHNGCGGGNPRNPPGRQDIHRMFYQPVPFFSLLACPLAEKSSEIEVTLLNEPDYVQMTLDWLDRQKSVMKTTNSHHYPRQSAIQAFDSPIAADFSAAFLCGAL